MLDVTFYSSGSVVPSASSATRGDRKRARSPSVSDVEGSISRGNGRRQEDDAQSPLAKRKKLSAARRGSSRLKVGLVAGELSSMGGEDSDEDADEDVEGDQEGGEIESDARGREEQDSLASTDGNGDNDGDDDDFLARELEEEVG